MSHSIAFPPDFKPAPLDRQIRELEVELHYFEKAVRAGRVHPGNDAFRRWCIKSAIWQLTQLEAQTPTVHNRAPALAQEASNG